jgi:hypothetical protein
MAQSSRRVNARANHPAPDGELWDNAGQFDCVAILYR